MESSNKTSEYRSIFKATSILGSVQLFNILISAIRNKVVSSLLGPAGMGIVGLLTSTSSTITGFTNCGLTISAMKNIAVAYKEEDYDTLGKVIFVVKRLIWCTGLFATLICIILSKQLSVWAFGNEDFMISFCCLSISLLFTQLTSGNQMIIKGCRQIKMYAKANVIGNFLSLFITIPLYFIWGVNAIVPVLILLSISTATVSYYYQKKILIKEIKVDTDEFKKISADILKIGVAIAAAEVFPIISSYYIRIFMSENGGVELVGLFSAGFAILNGYVGMIFSAMSSDFVPRLSAVIDDNKSCEETVNNQIRISIMILLPILTLLIIFSKTIVWILYSSDFYPITKMIMWGAIGSFLQCADWAMGFLFVPKRDTKVYFGLSIWSLIKYLALNIVCYHVWGLPGFGIAMIINRLLAIILLYFYMKYRYDIIYSKDVLIYLLYGCIYFTILIILNTLFEGELVILTLVNIVSLLLVSIVAFKKLDQYMGLKNLISRKILKKK